MILYAETPGRRTRQLLADVLLATWVTVWVLVGRWTFDLVMTISGPAAPLRRAGNGLHDSMTSAADRARGVPLVGDGLDAPFTGAAGVGTDLVSAGDRLETSAHILAVVVSLLASGTPILLVLLVWGMARWLWLRRARPLRSARDAGLTDLLAFRALARQSPRRLQKVASDPVAAFRSDDAEALRLLADLELGSVGLRSLSRA